MLRIIFLALSGCVLAILLAMQAAGSVTARTNPSVSQTVFPFSGAAMQEEITYRITTEIKTEQDIPVVARALNPVSQRAFAKDPLGPKALAIAALNAETAEVREAILKKANALNRRDAFLQSLILEQAISEEDFDQVVQSLDRIFRVHPEQRVVLFPVLIAALEDERSLPAFARVLDGSSDWHDALLLDSASNDSAIANLARLRFSLDRDIPGLDPVLVSNLARLGELDTAAQIYQAATNNAANLGQSGALKWSTQLAPFDWKLADDAGFRAQPSRDGGQLEIFVRSGKGGIIARRMAAPSSNSFTIAIDHQVEPADSIGNVRLELRCAVDEEPFLLKEFVKGTNRFAVVKPNRECPYIDLAIYARSWSGRAALGGTIDSVSILER